MPGPTKRGEEEITMIIVVIKTYWFGGETDMITDLFAMVYGSACWWNDIHKMGMADTYNRIHETQEKNGEGMIIVGEGGGVTTDCRLVHYFNP